MSKRKRKSKGARRAGSKTTKARRKVLTGARRPRPRRKRRGTMAGASRRPAKSHEDKANIIIMGGGGRGLGNPCSQASPSLLGKGRIMPKKKGSRMPWFVKGKRRRRARLGGMSYMGGSGDAVNMLKAGGLTLVGAGVGSVAAARLPLPAGLAKFRAILPIALGLGLGMSKFGKRGAGQSIALGMMLAGGLALGRQFAPQFFAGEDEMLGLPMVEGPEAVGIEYQAGEDEIEGEEVEGEEVEGEEVAELFGAYATPADM